MPLQGGLPGVGWRLCAPGPASAVLHLDPCALNPSQEQMQLPQVTMRGLPWKTKKSFSRSTLRGPQDSSETDLKLDMVSKSAQVSRSEKSKTF